MMMIVDSGANISFDEMSSGLDETVLESASTSSASVKKILQKCIVSNDSLRRGKQL